jgi:hypothetical protein
MKGYANALHDVASNAPADLKDDLEFLDASWQRVAEAGLAAGADSAKQLAAMFTQTTRIDRKRLDAVVLGVKARVKQDCDLDFFADSEEAAAAGAPTRTTS